MPYLIRLPSNILARHWNRRLINWVGDASKKSWIIDLAVVIVTLVHEKSIVEQRVGNGAAWCLNNNFKFNVKIILI